MAELRQAPQNTWPQVVEARKDPFSLTSVKLSRQTGQWEVWALLEEEEGGGDRVRSITALALVGMGLLLLLTVWATEP